MVRSIKPTFHAYRGHIAGLLLTVVMVHGLTVWFLPRAIMVAVLKGSASQTMETVNGVVLPPPVTASSRSIVMPSPDLLYSLCRFDLSNGPMHITANPQHPKYWSLALYAANSDNFFVRNDQQTQQKPINFWLVQNNDAASRNIAPQDSEVIESPTARGLLLMRILTSNYAQEKTAVEAARRTLRCTPQ